MKLLKPLSIALSLLLLFVASGCWTFNETPYPETAVTAASESTNITVRVSGFLAALTEYSAVHSYRTIYVPGCGRHHWSRYGYYETFPTVSYVPQIITSDIFLRRARDSFEQAGYSIGANTPDWTVDVEFSGPIVSDSDIGKQLAWVLGTVFFCDYETSTWRAKLKIRNNHTGRLVFHRDYTQRYETNVFGLIPLFGISSCRATSQGEMQAWCLSALVDRTVADATAFLASEVKR